MNMPLYTLSSVIRRGRPARDAISRRSAAACPGAPLTEGDRGGDPEDFHGNGLDVRQVRTIAQRRQTGSADDSVDLLLGLVQDFGVLEHGEEEVRDGRDGL